MGFKLKVIAGPKNVGTFFDLQEGENLAGRVTPPAQILLDSAKVSKKHCNFIHQGQKLSVKDLGSSNGVYLNSKKIMESELKNKDRLVLGEYTLEVVHDAG